MDFTKILMPFLFILVIGCSSDNTEPVSAKDEAFSGELYFSEYIEGSSFNKALEIVNRTGVSIDLELEGYSIKKQTNGSGNWVSELPLSGTISHNDVYVIGNESTKISEIIQQSNLLKTGAPMDFNGNDPLGLFKNGVLVDIIGVTDISENFGLDVTLRRKQTVTAPNIIFSREEWEVFDIDTVDDLGKY